MQDFKAILARLTDVRATISFAYQRYKPLKILMRQENTQLIDLNSDILVDPQSVITNIQREQRVVSVIDDIDFNVCRYIKTTNIQVNSPY